MLRKTGRPTKKLDSIPNRIREVRETRGVTIQQLADLLGRKMQTVQRYETGEIKITLDMLEKIAAVLDVPTIALVNPRSERASA